SPLFQGLVAFVKALAKESRQFLVKSLIAAHSEAEAQADALLFDRAGALDLVYKDSRFFAITLNAAALPPKENRAMRILSVGGSRGILKEVYSSFPSSPAI